MNEEANATRVDSIGAYNATNIGTVGVDIGAIKNPIVTTDYAYNIIDKSTNVFDISQTTASLQTQWLSPSGELKFDGVDDFLNIDSVVTPLATTTIGTWACWVKPSGVINDLEYFMSFGDTNADTHISLFKNSTGKLVLQGTEVGSNRLLITTDASPFTLNTWTHIVVITDGVAVKLYADNVLVSQTDTSLDATEWFNSIVGLDNGRIGCVNKNSAGNTDHFNGSIAEPLIYNTNLTSSQITDIYNYSLATYS